MFKHILLVIGLAYVALSCHAADTGQKPAPGSAPVVDKSIPAVTPAIEATVLAQSAQLQKALLAQSAQLQNSLSEAKNDLKNDLLLYSSISSLVILTLIVVLVYRTRPSRQSTPTQEGPTSADIAQFILSANNLRAVLNTSGKLQPSNGERNLKPQPSLEEVCNKLVPIISKELVKLLQESENGKLTTKLTQTEQELTGLRQEYDSLSREIEPVRKGLQEARDSETKLRGQFEKLQDDKSRLENQLTAAITSSDNLKKDADQERERSAQQVAAKEDLVLKLDVSAAEVRKLDEALATERTFSEAQRSALKSTEQEVLRLTAATRRAYDSLAPSKLVGTELVSQVEGLHREALAGDLQAVSAWSSLASFGSAQMDPAAKDFQLQIVRRLGVVMVQYWKQKGLTAKERHEYLSLWARHLNEHADGRFNLFVPGLGAPIDKTRMVCATSSTIVNDVLCWQIRNPAGANFMLAEVA